MYYTTKQCPSTKPLQITQRISNNRTTALERTAAEATGGGGGGAKILQATSSL